MNIKQSPRLRVIIESEKVRDLFEVFMLVYHEYIPIEEVAVNDKFIQEFNELFHITLDYLDETFHLLTTDEKIYDLCPDFIDHDVFSYFVASYPIDDFKIGLVNQSLPALYDKHGTVVLFGDVQ